MDNPVYIESLKQVEDQQKNNYQNAFANIPIARLGMLLAVWVLGVVYLIQRGTLGKNSLYATGIGILVLLYVYGYQNSNKDRDITELQAKSILLKDLWLLKRSGTREFDGLMGTFDTHGEIRLDDSDSNPDKWIYLIGWYHKNRFGTKYYMAEIFSKAYKAKVKALAIGIGKYEGEHVPNGNAVQQPSPKNINVYYPRQETPIRF